MVTECRESEQVLTAWSGWRSSWLAAEVLAATEAEPALRETRPAQRAERQAERNVDGGDADELATVDAEAMLREAEHLEERDGGDAAEEQAGPDAAAVRRDSGRPWLAVYLADRDFDNAEAAALVNGTLARCAAFYVIYMGLFWRSIRMTGLLKGSMHAC